MPIARMLQFVAAAGLALLVLTPLDGRVQAQQTAPEATSPTPSASKAPTRFPADGLAILDCAPAPPAPADSCVLRVPPSRTRQAIGQRGTGPQDGDFYFEPELSKVSPELKLSKTIVLIDLTPGLRSERRPSWPRERALIANLIAGLPDRELVAIYGFNEGLERLTDFTTDKAVLAQTINTLDLRGSNTRIATNARDAIVVLGAQDETVLRNLIIVSDGEEEGTRAQSEVSAAAIEHGVTVSTLGMFWRPVGAPQNGAGQDYLGSLSEGTLGATGAITISRADEAQEGLTAFLDAVGGAIMRSGVILPRGTPVEAELTVTLTRPRIGQPGQVDTETVVALFTPTAMRDGAAAEPGTEPAPDAPPEADMAQPWYQQAWMGYPLLWWLIGGAILALLAVVGLVAVLRKGATSPESVEGDPVFQDANGPFATPMPPAPVAPVSVSPALAYLVRADTGERLAMRKTRITIGRAETCDVVLPDRSVSRLHAEMEQQGPDLFVVADSGSLNKTRVNGKEIKTPRQIKPGDTVSLGDVSLRLTLA